MTKDINPNRRYTVCFDVDGTLIDYHNTPRYDVINILRSFQQLGFYVVVWSGCGEDYARHWNEKLGLKADKTVTKGCLSFVPNICFDDESDVFLAEMNIKV